MINPYLLLARTVFFRDDHNVPTPRLNLPRLPKGFVTDVDLLQKGVMDIGDRHQRQREKQGKLESMA